MARAAGLDVPEARLFETARRQAFFGVRRFDRRPGNRRLHAHSLGGLLQADFRVPSCDYDLLLKVTRRLTHDQRAVVECVRRMLFNVVAHNRDDHVKNFAFLLDDAGAWSLAPAYDLTCSSGPGGEHQMSIDGEGALPTREGCLALAERHGVARAESGQLLEQVNDAVAAWRATAKATGCRAVRIREVARAHRAL